MFVNNKPLLKRTVVVGKKKKIGGRMMTVRGDGRNNVYSIYPTHSTAQYSFQPQRTLITELSMLYGRGLRVRAGKEIIPEAIHEREPGQPDSALIDE